MERNWLAQRFPRQLTIHLMTHVRAGDPEVSILGTTSKQRNMFRAPIVLTKTPNAILGLILGPSCGSRFQIESLRTQKKCAPKNHALQSGGILSPPSPKSTYPSQPRSEVRGDTTLVGRGSLGGSLCGRACHSLDPYGQQAQKGSIGSH